MPPMDPQTILHHYDREMRANPPDGTGAIHQRPGLTYFTVPPPSPLAGWVIYTRLAADTADQAIRSTIDFFKPLGGEFEWKVYDHDTPPDMKQRLLDHGFTAEELEAVLAFDMEAAPPGFWEPPAARVLPVTDPAQLADIARIEAEVWNESYSDLPEVLDAEMRATPDRISVFIAYAGGEPASGAWIRYYPGTQFAELYGGATLARHRGQGLYTALVKARAVEARQRGVRFLVVDTSPMSRPILEKRGFVFLTNVQGFVFNVGAAPGA
jgi:GNAT superfamily N-acetyltransferase